MNFTDMILLGLENLARTKLRTLLTMLGVVVGIGALSSMISFGTGIQKNVTDAFYKNDLFTSMSVTPKQFNLNQAMEDFMPGAVPVDRSQEKPITDSVIDSFRAIEGVEIAIPDISFPVRSRFLGQEVSGTVQVLPPAMRTYKPYSNMLAGTFYDNDTSSWVVMREEELNRLNIIPVKEGARISLSHEDSVKGVRQLSPDSIIGMPIEVVSVRFDPSKIRINLLNPLSALGQDPLSETVSVFRVSGIMKRASEFSFDRFRGGIVMAPGTASHIPKLSFNSVWDILSPTRTKGSYSSVYVRVIKMEDLDRVRKQIESAGFSVFSLADQLEQFKQQFLIINSLLGAIGFIALFVAALGIINTMLMTILERTREIGIMKAIGGSEREIRWIFFTEAGTIGFFGGLLGLVLGYLVTRVANLIINAQLPEIVQEKVDMFYFPLWLLAGSLAFAVVVSLVAGLYPATRAARIDPVKALRHD
jgi:putative ABC transport system permease protein